MAPKPTRIQRNHRVKKRIESEPDAAAKIKASLPCSLICPNHDHLPLPQPKAALLIFSKRQVPSEIRTPPRAYPPKPFSHLVRCLARQQSLPRRMRTRPRPSLRLHRVIRDPRPSQHKHPSRMFLRQLSPILRPPRIQTRPGSAGTIGLIRDVPPFRVGHPWAQHVGYYQGRPPPCSVPVEELRGTST